MPVPLRAPFRVSLLLLALSVMSIAPVYGNEVGVAEPGAPIAQGRVVIEPPRPMPGLDRSRTLRIYLPPGYDESDERYPVLYMHDGQNLFEAQPGARNGEWQVDEALDRLFVEHGLALIVVGIDNGGELRARELLPWVPPPDAGRATSAADEPTDAAAYLAFITDTVKPWVDERYRTRPEREHTGIMGSSFGGVASHHALLSRPDVFSRFGLLSPSYWVSDEVYTQTESATLAPDLRISLKVGTRERQMVPYFNRMMQLFWARGLGPEQLQPMRVPNGTHSVSSWREQFPGSVLYLFGTEAGS